METIKDDPPEKKKVALEAVHAFQWSFLLLRLVDLMLEVIKKNKKASIAWFCIRSRCLIFYFCELKKDIEMKSTVVDWYRTNVASLSPSLKKIKEVIKVRARCLHLSSASLSVCLNHLLFISSTPEVFLAADGFSWGAWPVFFKVAHVSVEACARICAVHCICGCPVQQGRGEERRTRSEGGGLFSLRNKDRCN